MPSKRDNLFTFKAIRMQEEYDTILLNHTSIFAKIIHLSATIQQILFIYIHSLYIEVH